MLNALTVDVEDYFQVSAFEHRIPRQDWGRLESRVVANTRRLLSLFQEFGVQATFFVLGWVAERFPFVIKEIDARGHEIGSHSYWHRLIYRMTPDEFRADLRQSKKVLEHIIGREVTLYRAPSFSITADSTWALPILVDEGFQVDSSIFPVHHDRYGMPGAKREPHELIASGGSLCEFPPSVITAGRFAIPVSGGGYFRLYPLQLTQWAVAHLNRNHVPFMFYIHPWEIDVQQPRVNGIGWRARARHYVNLSRTEGKLRDLLTHVRFGTVSQALERYSGRSAMAMGSAARTLNDEPIATAIAARNTQADGAPIASGLNS
jgi:polysaccharide deacetylase family protein (PEP-CTERM system associated)